MIELNVITDFLHGNEWYNDGPWHTDYIGRYHVDIFKYHGRHYPRNRNTRYLIVSDDGMLMIYQCFKIHMGDPNFLRKLLEALNETL